MLVAVQVVEMLLLLMKQDLVVAELVQTEAQTQLLELLIQEVAAVVEQVIVILMFFMLMPQVDQV